NDAEGKIGITVPKKVGKAHVRNKIKRQIRHILRTNPSLFFDKILVVVVRDSASAATFSELQSDIIETCKRLKDHKMPTERKRLRFPSGAYHEYSI
ncbi:MAG TPA: ribonuclease P protein component, partial [Myxococcota bacterium]|nr:ribonuclease P protein component [Myxococcota bacterium]